MERLDPFICSNHTGSLRNLSVLELSLIISTRIRGQIRLGLSYTALQLHKIYYHFKTKTAQLELQCYTLFGRTAAISVSSNIYKDRSLLFIFPTELVDT